MIKQVIDRNYDRAKQILQDNMDVLHTMKDALMKYETIDARQIDDLMARREVRAPSNWHDEHGDTPQGGASVSSEPEAKPKADESAPLSDIDKANDIPAK